MEDKEWGNVALRDGLLAFCCLWSQWPRVHGAQTTETFPKTLTKMGRDRQDINTEMFPSPGSSCIPHPDSTGVGMP